MTPKKKAQKGRKELVAQRYAQEQRRKLLEKEADEEIIESVDDDSVEETPEGVEKEMTEKCMDSMPMPYPGPTSFDEMEVAEAEAERAHEVSELGWKVSDIVRNILYHPTMNAKERGSAIQQVGKDFEKRVSAVLDAPAELDNMAEKDIDILAVKSILAHDERHSNLVERWIDKAKVSYASREDMPDGNFALVTERDGKKIRKYLIHDKPHVRNALARAAQEMAGGGPGAADAKAAMPKIRAAAKKFGIEMSMGKERNGIVVEKDLKGDWRWIGWVSNNFQDTDGEIFTEKAHKEYVSFLDENPSMAPAFLNWHTPGTERENLPDFWTYENGFLIMSGKLTEKEARALLNAQKDRDLGMSHGTLVLERNSQNPRHIDKYRTYEDSDLPLENAANPFTALELSSKEANMNKLDYLAQFVGKERAEELLAQTQAKQEELTAAGIASKEKTEPEVIPPATPAEPVRAQTPATPPEVPDVAIKEIMERVSKEFDIPGLSAFVDKANEAIEKVPLLEKALKELQGSTDDQLADKIAPKIGLAWSLKNRASEKTDTVVGDDDPLRKAAPTPGENWLSEATGTKPIAL